VTAISPASTRAHLSHHGGRWPPPLQSGFRPTTTNVGVTKQKPARRCCTSTSPDAARVQGQQLFWGIYQSIVFVSLNARRLGVIGDEHGAAADRVRTDALQGHRQTPRAKRTGSVSSRQPEVGDGRISAG